MNLFFNLLAKGERTIHPFGPIAHSPPKLSATVAPPAFVGHPRLKGAAILGDRAPALQILDGGGPKGEKPQEMGLITWRWLSLLVL